MHAERPHGVVLDMPRRGVECAVMRSLRKQHGETQRDLADAIGVYQTAVSKWENSGRMNLANAIKVADHYGVSLDELSGRDFS